MEKNKSSLQLLPIRPEHASGEYNDPYGCAVALALKEIGYNIVAVAAHSVDMNGGNYLMDKPFYDCDFNAVRKGKTVEYMIDHDKHKMIRVEKRRKRKLVTA